MLGVATTVEYFSINLYFNSYVMAVVFLCGHSGGADLMRSAVVITLGMVSVHDFCLGRVCW